LIVGGAIGLAVVAGLFLFSSNGTTPSESPTPPVTSGQLQGVLTTDAPWPPNTADLAQRLSVLNLPAFQDNPGHHHARLWIYVDGQQEPVAEDIGIGSDVASPLHTHAGSSVPGIIHIESADPNYQSDLGTFFDVWGVRLTQRCMGSYCNTGDAKLQAFVNGEPYEGDPRTIPLDDQTAIVLAYGTQDQLPDPIPNSFDFTG
jgi:hypothetical protein